MADKAAKAKELQKSQIKSKSKARPARQLWCPPSRLPLGARAHRSQ